jgi:hypothetical protein
VTQVREIGASAVYDEGQMLADGHPEV